MDGLLHIIRVNIITNGCSSYVHVYMKKCHSPLWILLLIGNSMPRRVVKTQLYDIIFSGLEHMLINMTPRYILECITSTFFHDEMKIAC